ncbi:MAG: hypothetical protein ACLUE8_17235 [Lachnospiraceae bacterium]
MKKSNGFMRWITLLFSLPILLCAILSMSTVAVAEVIDPEDCDGLVILEDPALLGGSEEDEPEEPGITEPACNRGSSRPKFPRWNQLQEPEPTSGPTLEPTALPEAAYEITMVPPEGWYLTRAVMELTITDLNGTGVGKT